MSCGYTECFWGRDWFNAKQLGGSEAIMVELACELAAQGHAVTVRLPYASERFVHRGVEWVGQEAGAGRYDLLFCLDDFARRDHGDRTVLVANRSDPPQHTDFDALIFLSKHHAALMGHPGAPAVGGAVHLSEFATNGKRQPGLVICTSSPDRCLPAYRIGAHFPRFTFTYRPIPGLPPTVQVTREELVALKKRAMVQIYPLDPSRPSDFFSIAVLEAMAAGTPVVVSDADSMQELWDGAAIVLPRPIDVGNWVGQVEELMTNKALWRKHSEAGLALASQYTWANQAKAYLKAAGV